MSQTNGEAEKLIGHKFKNQSGRVFEVIAAQQYPGDLEAIVILRDPAGNENRVTEFQLGRFYTAVKK